MDKIFDKLDVIVVGNNHREPVITKDLDEYEVPYILHESIDYNLPEGWKPLDCYKHLVKHLRGWTGHCRCNSGHADGLAKATKDYALVIEDDAKIINDDWLNIVKKSIKLLSKFELVSLHSREVKYEVYNKKKLDKDLYYFEPKDSITPRWNLGSLSYVIAKDNYYRIIENKNFVGLPMDLTICNTFYFSFVEPSPFEHIRKNSLIDYGW